MTPTELLDQLESLGAIDEKTLRKLRAQVDNPERSVKTSAVLGYLVKKEKLTEDQAKQLMRGEIPQFDRQASDEVVVEVEEIEVVEPVVEPAEVPQAVPMAVPIETAPEPPAAPEITVDTAEPAGLGSPESMDQWGSTEAEADQSSDKKGFVGKKNTRDQWTSRWPFIGFGILGFLAIIGFTLFVALTNMQPEAEFKAANDKYNEGNFATARKLFADFLENFPNHDKYSQEARAKEMHSLLAETYENENWKETLNRTFNKLPPFANSKDEDYASYRTDICLIIARSLAELSTGTLKDETVQGMTDNLARISELKKALIDAPAVFPSSERKRNAKSLEIIDNNIRTLSYNIQKEKDYSEALVTIRELGDSGKTNEALELFVNLTRQYGDLAVRDELRSVVTKVSKQESALVQQIDFPLTTVKEFEATAVEQSMVLGSFYGEPDEGLRGEIVPTLVDGSIYGIDAGGGEILWRIFVGIETGIHPITMDGESVLISDLSKQQVLKVRLTDGALIWRSSIGETFFEPAFKNDKLFITTATGKILRLNPATGELVVACQLPQKANTGALISEQHPLIYQTGFHSNLYVLSTEDLTCTEVQYLGHFEGSIGVPPLLYNGYVVLLINGGNNSNLNVLRVGDTGSNLELVQVIDGVTNGPVTEPIRRFTKWLLIASENGEMVVLEYNQGDEASPVTRYAKETFKTKRGQPAFFATTGSEIWVTSTVASYYKVRNLGQFDLRSIVNEADDYVAPCKELSGRLFHVRKRANSGMVSVSLVNSKSLDQPIWRNDFAGAVAGPVIDVDGQVMAVSSQGDVFRIDKSGYVSASAQVGALDLPNSLRLSETLSVGDFYAVMGGIGSKEYITFDKQGELKTRTLFPPTDNPACVPIAVGNYLIVANQNGQVAAVRPDRGELAGEPFQPPVAPGEVVRWIRPIKLSDEKIAIATQSSGKGPSTLYILDVEAGRSIRSAGELASAGSYVGGLSHQGTTVFAAERTDAGDFLVTVDAASMQKNKAPVDGKIVGGPWAVADGVLVRLDSDQLAYFSGSDLTERWKRPLANEQFAAAPQIFNDQLALMFKRGLVMFLNPQTGEENEGQRIELRQPIASGPTFINGKGYFPGLDGTIHVLNAGGGE